MSNFIQQCIEGDALITEVDDYIDQWHESDTDLTLHEFLGMTRIEYALFVEDESYLGAIINAHINQISTEEVVESLAMVARSDNQAKSNRLMRWLKDENLWD